MAFVLQFEDPLVKGKQLLLQLFDPMLNRKARGVLLINGVALLCMRFWRVTVPSSSSMCGHRHLRLTMRSYLPRIPEPLLLENGPRARESVRGLATNCGMRRSSFSFKLQALPTLMPTWRVVDFPSPREA